MTGAAPPSQGRVPQALHSARPVFLLDLDQSLQFAQMVRVKAPTAWRLVDIEMDKDSAMFIYTLNRQKLRRIRRWEGRSLLRTNLTENDPALLRQCYSIVGVSGNARAPPVPMGFAGAQSIPRVRAPVPAWVGLSVSETHQPRRIPVRLNLFQSAFLTPSRRIGAAFIVPARIAECDSASRNSAG